MLLMEWKGSETREDGIASFSIGDRVLLKRYFWTFKEAFEFHSMLNNLYKVGYDQGKQDMKDCIMSSLEHYR